MFQHLTKGVATTALASILSLSAVAAPALATAAVDARNPAGGVAERLSPPRETSLSAPLQGQQLRLHAVPVSFQGIEASDETMNQFMFSVGAAYGVIDNLELAVDLPIYFQQLHMLGSTAEDAFVGDLTMALRYGYKVRHDVQLVGRVGVKAPTGRSGYDFLDSLETARSADDVQLPTSTGHVDMDFSLSADWANGSGLTAGALVRAIVPLPRGVEMGGSDLEVRPGAAFYGDVHAGMSFADDTAGIRLALLMYKQGNARQDGDKVADTGSGNVSIAPGVWVRPIQNLEIAFDLRARRPYAGMGIDNGYIINSDDDLEHDVPPMTLSATWLF